MRKMKSLGVMIDCSRDAVYTVEALKNMFGLISKMGYNVVQLYTEDIYEIDGEPYFGYLRGRYTKNELKELNTCATNLGLELVPCIQTLAHLGGITRWEEYKCCTDTGDILLADNERTYELIEKMLETYSECFSSRRINIGMDEAHMVGLGKYLDEHGYENRFDILLAHINRVSEIAKKYGFSLMMWSDMFFRLANSGNYDGELPQNILSLVPENISLVYWDYYNTEKEHYDKMLRAHLRFPNKIAFAGGAWSWIGFAPANEFAILSSEAAIRSCTEHGIEEVYITCWKDDGAESSLYSILPSLMCAAEFANGNFDREKIAERFYKIVGIPMADFLALDRVNLVEDKKQLPCNPSKYMLYSDPFLGIFDGTVSEGDGQKFSAVRDSLLSVSKNETFGYLFRTIIELCNVLELKYGLGIRTRKAYSTGNKEALGNLLGEYTELETRINRLYAAFRTQWEKECKPYGFEKHDIRLGGLVYRIKHCAELLKQYLDGTIASIEPLEEKILPVNSNAKTTQSMCFNDWLNTAMIKSSPV